MELTFTESMKDKAARMMSTPFSEIVEEATSELLLSPDYGRIMMLCDSVNSSQKDYNTDVVRAVRRRIDHKIPKVQYFTVVVVEALIKNCGPQMHAELAECKGLQKDLIAVALRDVSRDGEGEAKDVALQLILDCSHWFRKEVATEKTKALGEMITYVNKAKGGRGHTLFEGRAADTSININRVQAPKASQAAPDRNASARARQQRQAQNRQQSAQRRVAAANAPIVVDAIPIIPPTEEEVSGMMDAVMLLAEQLNAAEQSKSDVSHDEMITAISGEVRAQHRKLSLMISSGAELESMEVLLSITDSQVEVIKRLSSILRSQGQVAAAQRIAEDHNLPESTPGSQQQFEAPPPQAQVPPPVAQQHYQQQPPVAHPHPTHVASHPTGPPPPGQPPSYTPASDVDALIAASNQPQQSPYQTQPPVPAPVQQQPSYPPPAEAAPYTAPPPSAAPAVQQQVAPPMEYNPQPVAPPAVEPTHQPAPAPVNPQPAPSAHQTMPHPYTAHTSEQQAPVQPAPAYHPAPVEQQVQPAPPPPPAPSNAAPSIDDLFGDTTITDSAPVVSAPPPPPAPVQDDLWGSPKGLESDQHAPAPPVEQPVQAPVTRSAADIDDVPPQAPPAATRSAFPAPNQQLDPAQVDTQQEDSQKDKEPAVVGSLNGGDDEFDAFLNNRLGN